jgi:predicted phosphoribosyltransferase
MNMPQEFIGFFENRIDAGRKLGVALASFARKSAHLVVGLPRGGVIVAKEVAFYLELPMDILVARKIGAPISPELAMGALAGDVVYLDEETVEMVGATKAEVAAIIEQEKREAARRERVYRAGRKPPVFKDLTILLVDDGIATGATLRASIDFLKKQQVSSIVVAVPVAPPHIIERIAREVTQVVCLATPSNFFGVSQFYNDFTPVTDEEVCNALKSQFPKGS